MGSSSSKHAGKENRNSSLSRAVSLPVYPLAEKGNVEKLAVLKTIDDDFIKKETESPFASLASHSKQKISHMTLKTLLEEEWEINEARDRIEGQGESPNLKGTSFLKQRTIGRSLSSLTAKEVDLYLGRNDSPKSSKWRKHLQVHDNEIYESSNESPATPIMSRFNLFSPSHKWSRSGSEGSDFFPNDVAVDGRNTGLRLLLSPSTLLSSTNISTVPSTLIRSPSLNRNVSDSLSASSTSRQKNLKRNSEMPSSPDSAATCCSSWEAKDPLWDPVLLATFEKAVESVCENNLDSTTSSLSCSENISSSSETSSDADSPHFTIPHFEKSACLLTMRHNKLFRRSSEEEYARKLPSYNVLLMNKDWKGLESLENYEIKCLPGGEDKIILYFTSLRVIRKTFEDCERVRLILRGLRMHVDDRDLSIHFKFRQELTDLLGKGIIVPRLFIKGRYIGGIDEVMQLHEDGILVKLLSGLQAEDILTLCNGCGDLRFIPCLACNGSCKMIAEDNGMMECPDCNENGLIMCPLCSS